MVNAAIETESSMAEPYLIKKYSSRRLYDVAARCFVTTSDVDRLIRQGQRILVLDANGKDATRGVLLQILTEREEGGEPLLSVEILHDMVRLYGNVMHGPFGAFIEEGMAGLRKHQETWQNNFTDAFKRDTQGAFSKMLQLQTSWLKAGQDVWFGRSAKEPAEPAPQAKTPSKPASRRRTRKPS